MARDNILSDHVALTRVQQGDFRNAHENYNRNRRTQTAAGADLFAYIAKISIADALTHRTSGKLCVKVFGSIAGRAARHFSTAHVAFGGDGYL